MKMLRIPSKRLVNKSVSSRELKNYFGNESAEALLVALREGQYQGLFNFSITLDPDYIKWGEVSYKAQFPLDFDGVDLGYVRPQRYKLEELSTKILSGEALTEPEIQKVISQLPHDILEKYLRFKLSNLDYELLKDVTPKTQQRKRKDKYDRIEREGLLIDGTEVSYNGKVIDITFQQRQVLQVLLERYGKLVTHDVFTSNRDIFPKDHYKKDLNVRIGQLMSELHKKLRAAIGESCITNTSRDGWALKIE